MAFNVANIASACASLTISFTKSLRVAGPLYSRELARDRRNLLCDVGSLSVYIKKGKGKGSFYIAQYPVRWTAQCALHFLPSLADLFIPTPTRLLREAF